jgi:hypothetical protein
MIAALYVDGSGPYSNREDCDVWDVERDARKYAGPMPVVAHPPCSSWCQLAPVNLARWGSPIGADGGCFEAALKAVRRHGGVLEHPAYSIAWARYGLPKPQRGMWSASLFDPGLVTEVSQVEYGHSARKRTWLYTVGVGPVAMRWGEMPGDTVIGAGVNRGECVGRGRTSSDNAIHTPPEFLETLIEMAKQARTK